MNKFKVFEIKESIYKDNNERAEDTRKMLKEQKRFLINIMSSPGSGKTTLLSNTIKPLKDELAIGVLEADIDSDVDAASIAETGAKVIQLHTGGMCHLNADMTFQGLSEMEVEGLDMIFLENIGNLICPAAFDTGASKNVMILSVPEGDDKPLKYPPMFETSDVLVISKIDTAEYFNFSVERCTEYTRKLNPDIKIFPVSALTGEGMDAWLNWLREEYKEWVK